MAETRILVELDADDYDFIVNFAPERDRSATRIALVDVIGDIQDMIEDGYVGSVHVEDDRVAIK